ncbi:MAG: filamentous hemagglutinin N-terminal domain-containing protein [Calothrix sp. MO_192.B10]|nr:filamentous hemagglutinin N-terminal domain-containing protein [Calothrix sp. MO_192.B10]
MRFIYFLIGFFAGSLTYINQGAIFRAQAQIIPDDTLGSNDNSVVIPNQIIREVPSDRIDGGAIRGGNLFHSFTEFNIESGRGAYFTNPSGIENILTRVTGSNVSNILGTLGVLGNANLFLVNPNGIVFGQNARLDVNSSFVGSTANAIQFGNQGFFSATNPQPPSQLLTINPSAFFFNQLQTGRIESRSIAPAGDNLLGLRVPDGQSLLLVGGDITIDGGRLNALGGRLELAGLAGDGTIGLNVDGKNLSLSIPDDVARADVSINGARVDVSAGEGGSITVNARNLEVREGSEIFAGIRSGLGTPEAQAGDITINATDNVLFDNSFAFNDVNPGGVGNTGDVSVTTGSLEVTNGAELSASTFGVGDVGSVTITTGSLEVTNGGVLDASTRGVGDAGSVTINATDLVKFDGNPSGAGTQVAPGAVGKAGGVSITTKSLEVTNGALLSASTFGEGDAGSVIINANDVVKFDGVDKDGFPSGAGSQVAPRAMGKAGGVSITTNSLEVTNGAQLDASTRGIGDAGSVTINATGLVKFDGNPSGAFSRVAFGAEGKAGGVSITTGSLEVTNSAVIDASTFGKGDAGSVTINANDLVKFDGIDKDQLPSRAGSIVGPDAMGKAGGVSITTNSLEVTNGAQFDASTRGVGDAGSVTINATGLVKFDGDPSGAFSQVEVGAVGKAGGVSITTGSLEVTNGATLSASTGGIGDAGTITINANDLVKFDDSAAGSIVASDAVGKAGGVSITTDSLEVINGAQLNASTRGVGDAGSVNINATDLVKFDGEDKDRGKSGAFSRVESGAVGKAGGVSITTDSLEVTNGAEVNTNTLGEGDAGTVEITANTFEASNGGQIVSRTASQFSAGNIILNVTDNITLSDSDTGIFANTTEGSTGKGGNIIIDPRTFIIRDGATIAVNSQGEGIGGDIDLTAGFLTLDNGTISAETRSNTGGNITLNLQDLLLLRNGSQISTTAGNQQFGGNGGNITINNSPFIVALPKENSDITANAFTGNGGNINISTKGIFGIFSQERLTENSDITASSELGVIGNVTINTPEIDPSQGLVELPSNLVDASEQISNACTPGSPQSQSSFVATGRGGLPLSPTEPLQDTSTLTQWVKPRTTVQNSAKVENQPQAPAVTTSSPVSPLAIVEATGWVIDANGNVHLVAQAPQVNPRSPWQTSASCSAP